MGKTLTITFSNTSVHSHLFIGQNIFEGKGLISFFEKGRIAGVTSAHFKEKLPPFFKKESFLFLPDGEEAKTREGKEKIEDWLIKNHFNKDTLLIALGGGAILDVVGFVAATYCRGIPYISIPTTLLAMTDAAIGGKVAINVAEAKNRIGAVYPPERIYIDIDFLDTLPEKEFLGGLAEIIKHSLIGSASLFTFIQTHLEKIKSKDKAFLVPLLEMSIQIKKSIVEEDPYEKGLRHVLNFGHTIGHALEAASHYTLGHGEAVGLGMKVESYISMKMGFLSRGCFDEIIELLNRIPYPTPSLSHAKIKEHLVYDKKTKLGKPRFVILEKIGNPQTFSHEYVTHVPEVVIDEALSTLCGP